jgi:hypothetical protein
MLRQLPLTAWVTIAAIGYAAYYALACWIYPFTNCPRCHGTGKRRSPSGRNFRLCRRCKATGRRLRLGRRVANWIRHIHDDGTGGVK